MLPPPYVDAMLAGAPFLSLGSVGFALLQVGASRWIERLSEKFFPGGQRTPRLFAKPFRHLSPSQSFSSIDTAVTNRLDGVWHLAMGDTGSDGIFDRLLVSDRAVRRLAQHAGINPLPRSV